MAETVYKIIIYTTEQPALDMMETLDVLAAFPAGDVTSGLDIVKKHTTENKWWFYKDACIDNGGTGKAQISTNIEDALTAGDCTEESHTMTELQDDGWLPTGE